MTVFDYDFGINENKDISWKHNHAIRANIFQNKIKTLVRNNFCLSFCIFYRNNLHLSLILNKIQKYEKGKIRTTRTIADSPNLVNDYLGIVV